MALSSDIRYIVSKPIGPGFNEVHSVTYESTGMACDAAKRAARAGAGEMVVYKVIPVALFRAVTSIVEEKP